MKISAPDILNKLIEYLNITAAEFAESIGYERPQTLYDVINGKTKRISQNMADKILSKYPEINSVWILTGEGSMFNNQNETQFPVSHQDNDRKYQIVENIEDIPEQFRNWVKPFYPDMRVGAGLELGNYHGPTKYFILVPFSDKVQFWAQVEGKSMLPRYNNNDLVGLTEIHYDGVFPGHNYVVALKSGSAHLKRVEFIKEKPDTLNLVSLNPEYDPKEFYIDKIDKFFKVKMFISNDE
ncbi:hypothetical protein CMU99_16130 [Elizabethkingia anophelis]|nr:hypothetical protein [Elizabethkingia anophelis]